MFSHQSLEQSDDTIRWINVGVATLALIALSPVLVIVAVAVACTSRGPIIYSQPRVGLDRRGGRRDLVIAGRRGTDLGGRIFRIYKFRTMTVNAESASGAVWAQRGDSRVTSIGEFLRQSRLDELPQMFNVLLGDMNVVGPRPERPSLFSELRRQVSHYADRQRTRPGITGWAQIHQAYDASIDDVRRKVAYDLEYLDRRSAWRDIVIMVQTVPVMLRRRLGW
jgi:lipopolysaccharide/colanic/teichoic acid biosynthesis glycosyltransferase